MRRMEPAETLVRRRILGVAAERMMDEPVLLMEGPRSVGKSTVLRELAQQKNGELLDLDDIATREAVRSDPATMIAGVGLRCIDEYQRAPIVLDAIKAELNRASRPGSFVLTGSSRHESLPTAAQALTGRLHRLTVLPLAQSELAGTAPDLLTALYEDASAVVAAGGSGTTREEYVDRIVGGGFPLALARRSTTSRHRWFDDYVRLTLERDVQELSKIRQAHALPALASRLAGQTAQVLNITAAGEAAGLDAVTARDYVRLLEAVFLIYQLPAWGKTLTARSGAAPKVHVLDSGVAARLLRLSAEKLLQRDPTALAQFGHLLETFVVGELLKEVSWAEGITGVGHWRTYNGDEVDLIIERDDGGIVAFEVKAAARVPGEDFRGLRKLRDLLGKAFVAGAVLYTGTRAYTMEDRLHVLPIDRLWSAAA